MSEEPQKTNKRRETSKTPKAICYTEKLKQVQPACETLLALKPSTSLTSMIGGNRLERVATMVVKDMIKGDTVEFPTGGPVFINLLK